MQTQCTLPGFDLKGLGKRKVAADFQGGQISSDAGVLLLREVNHATHLITQFAQCFEDYRSPKMIEHSLQELLTQRVIGLALGYEDLNDHDALRQDPLFGVLLDKLDPTGMSRKRERDRGCCAAGKSTLNRLELTPEQPDQRYKKITQDFDMTDRSPWCDPGNRVHRQSEPPAMAQDPDHPAGRLGFFH